MYTILHFWKLHTRSVGKCFKSETAPFPAQKGQNHSPFFTIKKWPPISFLVHFYCIFMWQFFPSQLKTAKKNFDINTLPWFSLQIAQNSSKSACPQKFFPPHESPKLPPTHQIATFTNTAHSKAKINIQNLHGLSDILLQKNLAELSSTNYSQNLPKYFIISEVYLPYLFWSLLILTLSKKWLFFSMNLSNFKQKTFCLWILISISKLYNNRWSK